MVNPNGLGEVPDAVPHPAQVRETLGLRWHLVDAASREGNSPGHVRHRNVSPNDLMAKIHDRMLVTLLEGARDRWLDLTASEAGLRGLLVPLPAEHLDASEVSALVNSPSNDSPECVRPVG